MIEPGTIAPDFTLKNQFGEEVTLSSFRGSKPVVLVFFPLAFSGICTGELCEIRDNLGVFNDSDVELFGISVDSHFTQRAFAESQNYDFNLLADFWPHGKVAESFGVFIAESGIANRATIVIDKDGVVSASFVTAPGQAREFATYRDALAQLA
ncbi:MAG: peroxiredoxin [Actinobacteria bacterium]|nr:peroxiredoxin [Actinomycetota bacterium]